MGPGLLAVAVICFLLVPVPMAGQSHPPAPTTSDIQVARADSSYGWFRDQGDGTAVSDRARRFAALALWDWEGGDRFVRHTDALAFAQAGLRRWPHYASLWSVQAYALEHLGRTSDARESRLVADSLRSQQWEHLSIRSTAPPTYTGSPTLSFPRSTLPRCVRGSDSTSVTVRGTL